MNIIKTLTENRIKDIPDFHRVPAHDFRDDGSTFTCWVYKGIPMTQCRGGGRTYLCLRTDYISTLKKDGLSKRVAFEDSNRLAKYGYVITQIDGFYIKELKEMVEKYKYKGAVA